MISIHAPVRGATDEFATSRMVLTISIHAPVRGATTANCTCVSPNLWHFNPRSREGSDPEYPRRIGGCLPISIHAPVRGATTAPDAVNVHPEFQSTLPWGERPWSRRSRLINFYFNPRSREGSDFFEFSSILFTFISIHAPVRGATFVAVQDSTLAQISIHAPVRGATSDRSLKSFTISHFNPRSREGSDGKYEGFNTLYRISIHAPVRGATVDCLSRWVLNGISIHAPVRGATFLNFHLFFLHLFQSTLPWGERLLLQCKTPH